MLVLIVMSVLQVVLVLDLLLTFECDVAVGFCVEYEFGFELDVVVVDFNVGFDCEFNTGVDFNFCLDVDFAFDV